ncbi:MAG TPA: hypothetical protein VFP12_09860 [Allosphingosinicella sp.]|nr:hypothetical protein [Allosphingosinicella sp.]
MMTCSPDRPWGLHSAVRSDEDCPRCGWTAPGPRGDALADAFEALALAAVLGWTMPDPAEAFAA